MEADLGQASDGADLRVEVAAVWELLHHDGADVMQQRLLVHGVLHLWDLFQVAQLKAFSLECKHSRRARLAEMTKTGAQKPSPRPMSVLLTTKLLSTDHG